ncbi:MAG: carnitinyl-CoA dehydratase [Candidatus Pseudothioglobus sp.]|jgi:crotonobetainyl-CoA hydratase
MKEAVNFEVHGEVVLITLDRPKANAIDAKTSHELGDAFIEFRDDDNLRVAIITGAGNRFFCGGWDLKAASEGEAVDADFGPGGFAGLTELWDLNKPVIAAVNGLAVGGGFELALAADLIIASSNAEFFVPEATLGIIPDSGGVLRLPRRLPKSVAMDLLMTGRRMNVDEAEHYGLVNKSCPQDDLINQALEWGNQISKSAPLSLAAIKSVIRSTEMMDLKDAYDLMRSGKIEAYHKMLNSEDAKEGPLAFSEKRFPKWKGK